MQDRGGQQKTHMEINYLRSKVLAGRNLLDIVVDITRIVQQTGDWWRTRTDDKTDTCHQFVKERVDLGEVHVT
jgi:hypothetical protein